MRKEKEKTVTLELGVFRGMYYAFLAQIILGIFLYSLWKLIELLPVNLY